MIKVNPQLNTILKSNAQKPIMRIDVYPTANTVPSNGWFAKYYSGCLNSGVGNLVRTQFEPKIAYSYAYGLPVPLSNYVGFQFNTQSGIFIGNPYMITWSGYFFSPTSGNYTFGTRAYGGTRILVNGQDVLGGSGWNNNVGKSSYMSGFSNLNANTWTPIEIDFGYWGNQMSGLNMSHVTALYTPPNGTETLLTASSISPSGAFLQPTSLVNIMDIREDRDTTNTASLTFEVPITQRGSYAWNLNQNSYGPLQPGQLVKVYAGYATISGYTQTSGYSVNLTGCTDYIQRFVGFISSVSINQKYDSLTATVSCQDFTKKTINSINQNYPDFASYIPSVVKAIDSKNTYKIDSYMPNAYDNWYIIDAIKDLLYKADIDPIYINSNLINVGNYFRLEHNLSWPNTSYVDQYGQTFVNQDPFLFRFNYGDKIYDLINQLAELVGFQFRFDEQGNAFIKDPRYTSRIEAFETSGVNSNAIVYSGTWTPYYNANCTNGIFYSNISGVFGDNDSLVAKNTIAVYNFENNSNDYSSYGFNLTVNGNVPYVTSPTPPQGTYAAGPFSSINYFSTPPSLDNSIEGLGQYSIECFIYPINIQNTGTIYSYNSGYIMVTPSSGISWATNGNVLTTPNGVFSTGTYFSVGCSWNGQTKQIYVSGILQASSAEAGVGNYGTNLSTQSIGYACPSGIISGAFSGYIDQFRISNISKSSFPTPENTIKITSGINLNVNFSGVGFGIYYDTSQYGSFCNISVYNQNNTLIYSTGLQTFSQTNNYGLFQFIKNDLPYSGYKVSFYPTGLFKFEAIQVYEKNIFKPDYTFRANEDISLVSLEFSDTDQRNEIMVVGQQVIGGANPINTTISTNPNANDRYLYSRAIDLDSIWNPSASNYVGQEKTMVLVEPRLQSQRRIDWLASSLLKRYRTNSRTITLGLPGEPQLQINDVVGVVSNKIGINTDTNATLNTTGIFNDSVLDVFYVQKISSEISQQKYISNITVTSYPPIESWNSYLPPTTLLVTGYISTFGSVFTDWKVLNNNSPTDANAYDDLSLSPLFVGFNSFINLDRLWVLIDDRSIENFTDVNSNAYLGTGVQPKLTNFAIGYTNLNSPVPTYKFTTNEVTYSGLYTGVSVPGAGVFLHNGGGEIAGNLVLPNSMDSDFGGGQFYAQNSNNIPRLDGTYPVWIWGIGTFSDGSPYFTDLWQVPSGTKDAVTIAGKTYPALKVKGGPVKFNFQFDPTNTNNFIDMKPSPTKNFAYSKNSTWKLTTSHKVYIQLTKVLQWCSFATFTASKGDSAAIMNPEMTQSCVRYFYQKTFSDWLPIPYVLSSQSSNSPTQIYPGNDIIINPIDEFHVVYEEPGIVDENKLVFDYGTINLKSMEHGDCIPLDQGQLLRDAVKRFGSPPFPYPLPVIQIVHRGSTLHFEGFIVDAHTNAALETFIYEIKLNDSTATSSSIASS